MVRNLTAVLFILFVSESSQLSGALYLVQPGLMAGRQAGRCIDQFNSLQNF